MPTISAIEVRSEAKSSPQTKYGIHAQVQKARAAKRLTRFEIFFTQYCISTCIDKFLRNTRKIATA